MKFIYAAYDPCSNESYLGSRERKALEYLPEREANPELSNSCALLYQLIYQAKWELGPASRKSRRLFGPEKPFVFVCCKGNKITAKFRASRHFRFQDTKRIISPEMRPKSFGTFGKRVPGRCWSIITEPVDDRYDTTFLCVSSYNLKFDL